MSDFEPSQLEPYLLEKYKLIPLHKWDQVSKWKNKKTGEWVERPDGKRPMGEAWTTDPFADFTDPHGHMADGHNVGVRLRATDLIIDVDPRNGGTEGFEKLQNDLGLDLTDAPTVITGSGGLHVYYTKPADVSIRGTRDGYDGVEFKTRGQQVVSAGSLHPDTVKPYVWEVFCPDLKDVAPAPRALLDLIRRPQGSVAMGGGEMSQETVAKALDTMEATDFSEEGTWRQLMMACHHASGGDARDEFIEWSTRDPEYSHHSYIIGQRWDSLHADNDGGRYTLRTLLHFVRENGGKEGQRFIASMTAEDDFSELEPDPEDHDPDLPPQEQKNPLERLNDQYCIVRASGKARMYYKTDVDEHGGKRSRWESMDRHNFDTFLAHRKVRLGEGKPQPLSKTWIEWPLATRYNGIVFDPERNHPGKLNMWTGFGVEPRKGDWSYMQELISDVLCDGDKDVNEYVTKWMAYMFQKPWMPAETAIGITGSKGAGKSTLGSYLAKMCGQHGLHISSPEHIMGRFNSHLRDVVMLFADEAINPRDNSQQSRLKALITERTMAYEAKGQDIAPGKNMIHIIMASNDELIAPMSADERRFLTCQANDSKCDKHKFFGKLRRQMDERGGMEAMLFDLRTLELGKWAPRTLIPNTASSVLQKLRNLEPVGQWWYDHLDSGEPIADPLPDVSGNWGDWIEGPGLKMYPGDVWRSFSVWCRERDIKPGANGRATQAGFTRAIKRVCNLYFHTNVRLVIPDGRIDIKAYPDGGGRGVRVPSLAELRKDFERHMKSPIVWSTHTLLQ